MCIRDSIKSPYYINKADFVACHNPAYITKGFPIVREDVYKRQRQSPFRQASMTGRSSYVPG